MFDLPSLRSAFAHIFASIVSIRHDLPLLINSINIPRQRLSLLQIFRPFCFPTTLVVLPSNFVANQLVRQIGSLNSFPFNAFSNAANYFICQNHGSYFVSISIRSEADECIVYPYAWAPMRLNFVDQSLSARSFFKLWLNLVEKKLSHIWWNKWDGMTHISFVVYFL